MVRLKADTPSVRRPLRTSLHSLS